MTRTGSAACVRSCSGLGQQNLHEKPVFQTIKQLQQRLAELKRTLQKELVSLASLAPHRPAARTPHSFGAPQKLKPEPDPEGRERCSESRDRQERVCPDLAPASSPPPATIMVTNSVDLNDSREINFEYLKHVVLKFMSSREAEVSGAASSSAVVQL